MASKFEPRPEIRMPRFLIFSLIWKAAPPPL
jgi:hypothetical protein